MTTTKTTRGALAIEAGISLKHPGAELRITNKEPIALREFNAQVLRLAAEITEGIDESDQSWVLHGEQAQYVRHGESLSSPVTLRALLRIEVRSGDEADERRALRALRAVIA